MRARAAVESPRLPADAAEREACSRPRTACEEREGGYICTRAAEHMAEGTDGDHVAGGGGEVWLRWPSSEAEILTMQAEPSPPDLWTPEGR